MYYKAMQKRVEEVGTLNFPQQNGRKLYGELVVYIPVFQDGSIYQKEGGPRIERSSGNPRSTAPRWTSCAAPRRSAASRRICAPPTRTTCGS
jgi:hypothetical protein